MIIDSLKLKPLKGLQYKDIKRIVQGFKTTTPDHANYFNQALQLLIDNDVTLDNLTNEAVRELKLNQMDIAIELETLKGALLTGVDSNIMVQTFEELEGDLRFGVYNKPEKTLDII
ncbi:hypothetical protein PV797_05375 [Clostridiaceae bacterium M8S5]|nr:hypothetical protein PV797_05375 [Clostridiaceae bacterium M8S5]